MDKRIEKAYQIEKKGKYKKALRKYLKLKENDYFEDDRLFLARSIAACLFYLKRYTEAADKFKAILKDKNPCDKLYLEIETSLNLCFLYGAKVEKAEAYFAKRINLDNESSMQKIWNYWYLGQCYYLKNNYKEMQNNYACCVKLAEECKAEKMSFFLSHLIASELLNENYSEAEESINKCSNIDDKSFGLFKILSSLYEKKHNGKNWYKKYSEGIKEARKSGYKENIELGKFLLKKLY